jgi:hypothetical protein
MPVTNALVNLTKGKVNEAVRTAMNAIDKVHGDGNLPRIPVQQSSGGRRVGEFARIGDRPKHIKISPKGSTPSLNMAHEVGHFIEYSGIPKQQYGPRIFELSPHFKEWLATVKNSEAYAELRSLKSEKWMANQRPDGTVGQFPVDRRYVGYLLSPEELWARSYAQYIAHRSGSSVMIKEVASVRDQPSAYRNAHWTPADFEPIAQAIDKMFKGLGWIK